MPSWYHGTGIEHESLTKNTQARRSVVCEVKREISARKRNRPIAKPEFYWPDLKPKARIGFVSVIMRIVASPNPALRSLATKVSTKYV